MNIGQKIYYLKGYDRTSTISFLTSISSIIDNSDFPMWSGYIEHPTNNDCIIIIPQKHNRRIKQGIDLTEIESYLQKYLDDSIISTVEKDTFINTIINNQGNMLELGKLILDLFQNKEGQLIDLLEAKNSGYFG